MLPRLTLLLPLLLTACHHTTSHSLRTPPDPLPPTEGMWLPNSLPAARLQSLNFTPTKPWIDHLRLASVKVGASGSFVSPHGLILTNHHVALKGLHNISTPTHDYVASGFLAKSPADEIKLPGQEARVLISIQDVTDQVNAAVPPTLPPDQALKSRNAIIATLERESLAQTGLRSTVVTLYGGALFHLYRYQTYSDVRLVFAPEYQAAFFGGDPDNFEYPRYALDVAFLRAYDDTGKPAHTPHFLKLSPTGAREGDLVFVTGHPRQTDRLLPAATLRNLRDTYLPFKLEMIRRAEQTLLTYSARSDESRRQAQHALFSIQNQRKATAPQLTTLRAGLVEDAQRREDTFRTALRARPDLAQLDTAFDRIATAQRAATSPFSAGPKDRVPPLPQHPTPHDNLSTRYRLLEDAWAFRSRLFSDARHLARLAAEDPKPDADRLPEYTSSKRATLEHDLFSDYPFYPDLEIATLASSLQFLQDTLGPTDPLVKRILANQSPTARATSLIQNSTLSSAAARKKLYESGPSAIATTTDPMIQLARDIDPDARATRQAYESQVEEPQTQSLSDINRARFALHGPTAYPDATGTLRLSFGHIKSYTEDDNHPLPPFTTFASAFTHERAHQSAYPFNLPQSWHTAATSPSFSPTTPLNFISTTDITGGNSGSPVTNRQGHQVGLIFDSNRQGVPTTLHYSDLQARSISVDSRAILHSLQSIYQAHSLLHELTTPTTPPPQN